jgi:hypothetical protein
MAITNGYCTLADVKAALRVSDTLDDSLLEMAIESASRLVDGYCGREFYNAGTVTRVYAPDNNFVTELDDFVSISQLKISSLADNNFDLTWEASDYQTEPLNGLIDGIRFPIDRVRAVGQYLFVLLSGNATVQVTGVAGWSAVPIQVKQATVIQAMRIFKRLDSPLGITFGELGAMRVSMRLDPDVAQLVEALRRIRNVG